MFFNNVSELYRTFFALALITGFEERDVNSATVCGNVKRRKDDHIVPLNGDI